MATDDSTPKTKFKAIVGNGFFLGMAVGFAIGIAIDNLFIGIALAVALGVAWYAGKRKSTAEAS